MQIPSVDREWFVVRSKAGWEHLAAAELRQGGFETYLPMRRIRNFMRRQRLYTEQHKPAFVGHLFLADSPRIDWGLFRDNPRFRHVGWPIRDRQGFAHRLPGRLVANISVNETNGVYDETGAHDKLAERFVKGRAFMPKSGPFVTFPALVDGVTSSGLIRTLITIFGRDTVVTFDPGQLEEVA